MTPENTEQFTYINRDKIYINNPKWLLFYTIRKLIETKKERVCQNKVIGTSSFFFVSFFKKASSRPFWIDFSFDSILIAYHLIKRCFQSNFPVIKAL